MLKQLTLLLGMTIGSIFHVSAQNMAAPNKTVTLSINDQTIQLQDNYPISDLSDVEISLTCAGNPVDILEYKILYSDEGFNTVATLEGKGAPTQLSSPQWKDDVSIHQLEEGMTMMIRLVYPVDYLDEDGTKEANYMITLE